jgi:peptide/nickel transport system permease protein
MSSRRSGKRRVALYVLLGLLALEVLVVALAPLIAPDSPINPSGLALRPPTATHLLGTDELGRDVLSRVIWGGRGPLIAAVASVALGAGAGVPLGMVAGYYRSVIGSLIMRLTDVMLAFPALILGFVVIAILGPGEVQVAIAVAISFVPVFVRITYTSTISVRQHEYILVSRSLGLRVWRIFAKHVLPNIWTEVLVVITSAFGWALLLETTFSFLGLASAPPTPDWGADLSSGQEVIATAWWVSVGPGVALTITILLGNLFGDEVARRAGRRSRWLPRRLLKELTEVPVARTGST